MRALRVRHLPARRVGVDLMRRLWRIRLAYFALGDDRTEAEDWFDFSSYFTRERREVIVFEDGGEPVGFYVNSYDVVEHQGRRAVLVSIEYTYMHRDYRGHPAFLLAGFRMYLRLKRRFPLEPMYYVGFNFPNSFAFVNESFGRTFTLHEEPPAFEEHLLRWYGRTAGGDKWDDPRGLARYRNVPPKNDPRASASVAMRAHYARYDRINPTWRDGDALVVLAPADARAFASVLLRVGKRLRRELTGSIAA